MFEVQGKYCTAKVYTDNCEQSAVSQIINLCNQPFAAGSNLRMMPDVHAGAGCTIGTTMLVTDKVVPNLVGVDVGCGMYTTKLKPRDMDFAALDSFIHENIPAGMEIRNKRHPLARLINLEELRCKDHVNLDRAYLSIGSLGGGNHFIEVDVDNEGYLYLVVHTGSRYLGKQIAEYYQNLAWRTLSESPRDEIAKIVKKLKEQGRQAEISAAIANIPKAKVSKELAYLTGKNREDYLYDMGIAQFYASLNRQAIRDTILSSGLFGDSASSLVHSFETIHNYVDLESGILRKGAVSAQKGERLIIPINMRDGSLICIGKGNPEWNFSAPHGAGRLMSRAAAKERLTVEEFKKEMAGIFTTSVGYSTLDESPMAYKSMKDIVDNIHDTVEILEVVRPLYNFKAGE
jgi:hypothetical protein